MEERHYHGVVWPVLLIGAGAILLLNNLGYLPWDIWGVLWRLWPVLLIAAGLEIMFGRRSLLGSVLVALMLLAVLFGVIWWGLQQGSNLPPIPFVGGEGQELRTEVIQQSLEGADAAAVDISFGAGRLLMGALPQSPSLIEGEIELRPGERAAPEFDMRGSVAQFTLHNDDPVVIPTLGIGNAGAAWDLKLNRDVPLQLAVSTGAGNTRLDLTELNLTKLAVKTGVGRTEIFMPRQGRLDAQLDTAVGELTVVIPPDVGARIEIDGGLGNVDVGGKDYLREDDVYTSDDYRTAPNRLDLHIDAGIGSVVVR